MNRQMPNELKARYPFTCVCGKELDAAPSLSMLCGFNNGSASCPHCKTHLYLQLAPDIENPTHMIAERFGDYIQRTYPEESGGDE